jgi:hypothetical protein
MRTPCQTAAGDLRQFGGNDICGVRGLNREPPYLEKYKIGESLESESFLPGSSFSAVFDGRRRMLTLCLGIDSDHDRTNDLFSS